MKSYTLINKYAVWQTGGNFEEHDTKGTDLKSKENKARFYEKNEYRFHWTLSSTRPKSVQDECTAAVTPGISLHGELLDPQVSFIATTYQNL